MNSLCSGGLVAAALLFGQTNDPPSVTPPSVPPPPSLAPTPAPAPQTPQRGPILSFFTREDRPVLSKISSWFKREPTEPSATPTKGIFQRDVPAPAPAPTTPAAPAVPGDFPKRLPNPASKGPSAAPANTIVLDLPGTTKDASGQKEVVLTTAQQTGAVKDAKSPIISQFVNKVGRDEKFGWITGQLEMENGSYVLYYATPETVDKYHGRIVLQPQQVNMKELRRRDLISVSGQIVQRPGLQGMTPVYRVTSANLLERPKL